MITAQHLTHRYGIHRGIEDLNFDLPTGTVVGLLGPNGAGKTTTMNILSGLTAPQSGRVTIGGYSLSQEPIAARRHIGYLPEQPPLYRDMTVREHLRFVYELKGVRGVPRDEYLEFIAGQVGLSEVYPRLIGHLSKGYCQRVGLAVALLGDPDVLILDEPTVGLDPKQIVEMRALMTALGESRTVLLSTHILSEVEAVCQRVLVISEGKIVADGTPTDLAAGDGTLEAAFLRLTGEPPVKGGGRT